MTKINFYTAVRRKAAFHNSHGKILKILLADSEQLWKAQGEQVTSSDDYKVMFKVNTKLINSSNILNTYYVLGTTSCCGRHVELSLPWRLRVQSLTCAVQQGCHGNHSDFGFLGTTLKHQNSSIVVPYAPWHKPYKMASLW